MQVRLGEKETLDATLGFFEERYDKLASLEFYQVTATEYCKHILKCSTNFPMLRKKGSVI